MVFSIIGMLDFEHNDCMQSLYDLPGCTVCIGDSKVPFWFELLACQGNMHKEMERRTAVFCCLSRGFNLFFFCGQILEIFMLWVRLKKKLWQNIYDKKIKRILPVFEYIYIYIYHLNIRLSIYMLGLGTNML